jgi:hypothetical protein
MNETRDNIRRICLTVIALNMLILLAGCTANWINTTLDIIKVLIPAAASLLGLLGTLGLPVGALTAFTKWSTDATNALQNVVTPLIAEYNTAEATAQPGILGKIDSAVSAVLAELNALLPSIQVTDPASQAKISSLITEWGNELEALLNLIPVIKGEVADHDKVMLLLSKVKSAKSYKHDFNNGVKAFGKSAEKFQLK